MSEKFKMLTSKVPNYFLPQEDMENSMKKLHHNYSDVINFHIIKYKNVKLLLKSNFFKKVTSNRKEVSSTGSKLEKVLKTADIIKNYASSKKDLDRINKIFHS